MNTENIPYAPFVDYVRDSKPTNIRDTMGKLLFHWPLFLTSLLVCLCLAFAYLKLKAPGYTVKARLLIKDEEKGTGSESALQELNMFKSSTLVENEMELLKSRSIMYNAVRNLGLYIDYQEQGPLKKVSAYTSTPVKLRLLTPPRNMDEPRKFEITVLDTQFFMLKEGDIEQKLPFNTRLRNNFGPWEMQPTASLPDYIGKTITLTINNPDDVTDGYVSNLTAELVNKDATVVEMAIKETVPERGQDLLNNLIKEYSNAALNDKNKIRKSTLDFIDNRLASLTGELTSAEKDVEGFKSSKGIMDISSESSFYLENVKNNDMKLNEVNVQLEVVNGIERFINSSASTDNAPATAGITDPGLIALVNQLITLKLQRTQLMESTPEGSPVFENIDRQINATRQSLRSNIRGIKSSLISARNQLQNFNSKFESSIRQLPGQERQVVTMKRQQGVKEELYIYLLQKREEAAVSYATTIAENRMVDEAYFGRPDSPVGVIVLGVGGLMGLLLPLGLIFGRDLLNNKVESTAEIQEASQVPILGELAYQKSNTPLIMQENTRSMVAEQFRSLRTNLYYLTDHIERGRVTLLTSGMSGEGKSFVTSNLATALAASGKKTIILELDMRNPMIFRYFKINPGLGISNYLTGEASKEAIIQASAIQENLFVAGAGTLPTFPSELLEKPQMKELINWLTMNFDEILIDTPPVQLVTDAMILSRFSDVNLYVIRHRYTYKSHLKYINQLYMEKKMKNLQIVFNGVDTSRPGYGYAHGYNYYAQQESKQGYVHKKDSALHDFLSRF